jgi:hypothetical protein
VGIPIKIIEILITRKWRKNVENSPPLSLGFGGDFWGGSRKKKLY